MEVEDVSSIQIQVMEYEDIQIFMEHKEMDELLNDIEYHLLMQYGIDILHKILILQILDLSRHDLVVLDQRVQGEYLHYLYLIIIFLLFHTDSQFQ